MSGHCSDHRVLQYSLNARWAVGPLTLTFVPAPILKQYRKVHHDSKILRNQSTENAADILYKYKYRWCTNCILIYIQQDATLHSFLFGNCSTCFRWYFHPSSGAQTTLSTASGICQTVTATCRYWQVAVTV
jgi:hypothetical protein